MIDFIVDIIVSFFLGGADDEGIKKKNPELANILEIEEASEKEKKLKPLLI